MKTFKNSESLDSKFSEEVLSFLKSFQESAGISYELFEIYGIFHFVSSDKQTGISICQTAVDSGDLSCKIESANRGFLSFITKKETNSVLNLNGRILVNNNLYQIRFGESEQKRCIQIYENINIGEGDLYKQLNGKYTTVSLDKVFKLDDNSNIGLTLENASSLGCLWYNPDAFIDEITRPKVKKIGIKID